ncbi:hypothetical protein FRX31_032403 [Thalictrum thalictroides]|uniref:Uncharacterized protein n=1 Tax=Thalictrum thalictroides TaxID=46969 RepID=A0A7J6UZX8_THATH|nr:hypothetical protein FRX31_032403 [Thalictrum thalictroides]
MKELRSQMDDHILRTQEVIIGIAQALLEQGNHDFNDSLVLKAIRRCQVKLQHLARVFLLIKEKWSSDVKCIDILRINLCDHHNLVCNNGGMGPQW